MLAAYGGTVHSITPHYFVARWRHTLHLGGTFEGPFLDPDCDWWAARVRSYLGLTGERLDALRREHLSETGSPRLSGQEW
jgi:hypothetical protein